MIQLTIGDLLDTEVYEFGLKLIAGEAGLARRITFYRIQKTGLCLTGLYDRIHQGRLQIFGYNEIAFLESIPYEQQKEVLNGIFSQNVPCIIVTRGLNPPESLLEVCEDHAVALLSTELKTSTFIIFITQFLENNLTSATSVHGVLVDVLGVGVLLTGSSGVGKSECALELLLKGHKLVADDIVEVKISYPATVWGASPPVIKHHMEIRGLGILNIADLFGVTAVSERKKIQLVLDLVEWDGDVEYDRLGLEHKTYPILNVELPLITIPVSQGRNTAAIVEVAARNYLLQEKGIDSAMSFQQKLDTKVIRERLSSKAILSKRVEKGQVE